MLDEGAAVPADLRLFEVSQLHINEAILTGESLPVEKKIPPIHAKVYYILNIYKCMEKLTYRNRYVMYPSEIVSTWLSCQQL